MSIADQVLKEMKKDYGQQLNSQGIPTNPSQRTPDQESLARMIEAFIFGSVQLLVNNVSQGVLDNV